MLHSGTKRDTIIGVQGLASAYCLPPTCHIHVALADLEQLANAWIWHLCFEVNMEATKICTKCGKSKSATEEYWYKQEQGAMGLQAACKVCAKERMRLYREANREKINKRSQQRYTTNPDKIRQNGKRYYEANREKIREHHRHYYEANKEKVNERSRQYYAANAEKISERHKRYREVNREKIAERHRRYSLSNPEKNREKQHRRRARKTGNGGDYTPYRWKKLCAFYDDRCVCCGEQKPLTVDHVIPLSLGGTNSIDNIQPLCVNCNSRKGNRHATDYRKAFYRQGGLL